VLHFHVCRREDLAQKILEEILTEPSAEFRSPEKLFELADALAELLHFLRSLPELAEIFLDIAEHARGRVETGTDICGLGLKLLRHHHQLAVHAFVNLTELVAQISAERVHLHANGVDSISLELKGEEDSAEDEKR
jgi:hypothetical protein